MPSEVAAAENNVIEKRGHVVVLLRTCEPKTAGKWRARRLPFTSKKEKLCEKITLT